MGPAIRCAEEGFRTTAYLTAIINSKVDTIRLFPATAGEHSAQRVEVCNAALLTADRHRLQPFSSTQLGTHHWRARCWSRQTWRRATG